MPGVWNPCPDASGKRGKPNAGTVSSFWGGKLDCRLSFSCHDPANELTYIASLANDPDLQHSQEQRARAAEAMSSGGQNDAFGPSDQIGLGVAARFGALKPSVEAAAMGADIGVGFIPGISTAHDASVLLTGRNAITGDRVGIGGRAVAFAGMVTPASGGQIRGVWSITRGATGRVLQHGRFGKFYEHASTGLFWSQDTAGHGGSVWKVFTEEAAGLRCYRDADEFGGFILNKHEGGVGLYIPFGDLFGGFW